jgi:hypothetical protein
MEFCGRKIEKSESAWRKIIEALNRGSEMLTKMEGKDEFVVLCV